MGSLACATAMEDQVALLSNTLGLRIMTLLERWEMVLAMMGVPSRGARTKFLVNSLHILGSIVCLARRIPKTESPINKTCA